MTFFVGAKKRKEWRILTFFGTYKDTYINMWKKWMTHLDIHWHLQRHLHKHVKEMNDAWVITFAPSKTPKWYHCLDSGFLVCRSERLWRNIVRRGNNWINWERPFKVRLEYSNIGLGLGLGLGLGFEWKGLRVKGKGEGVFACAIASASAIVMDIAIVIAIAIAMWWILPISITMPLPVPVPLWWILP